MARLWNTYRAERRNLMVVRSGRRHRRLNPAFAPIYDQHAALPRYEMPRDIRKIVTNDAKRTAAGRWYSGKRA